MRVLVAAHGHPRLSPGGGEHAAYALHQAIADQPGFTSCFLAAAEECWIAEGQDLVSLDEREWLIRRSQCGFFHPTAVDLSDPSDLSVAVRDYAPDVVHLHHFFHLGLDLIHALRRWCPKARIVLTLHEFLALCPYNGQLLKRDGRLCQGPHPLECQQCLPERAAVDLLVREQMLLQTLAVVDVLVSPSQTLCDRWMQWANERRQDLPRPWVLENLLPPAWNALSRADARPDAGAQTITPRLVFGYFGQLLPSKGIDLLLEAWERLILVQPEAHLVIHGHLPEPAGPLAGRPSLFARRLQQKLQRLCGRVSFTGRYTQDQVPSLMAAVDWVVMASRWLENSPVVIQEARACGRPLLVPDHGGMAEKVRDGVDGLHYSAQSSFALSQLMWRCCREPDLWDQIRATQASPADQNGLVEAHLALYSGKEPISVRQFPER